MKKLALILATLLLLVPSMALASEEEVELPEVKLSYENVTWDQGRKVFEEVCINCHAMMMHKNPADNKPYEAKMKPEDAKTAFGKVPPDLTLMAKARHGGAQYIYALMVGFEEDKEKKCEGSNYNKYFPGNCIAMPKQSITEEQAMDVASFLWYTSEPTLLVREEIGWYVVPFSAAFTVLLFLLKKRVWADVKKKK